MIQIRTIIKHKLKGCVFSLSDKNMTRKYDEYMHVYICIYINILIF